MKRFGMRAFSVGMLLIVAGAGLWRTGLIGTLAPEDFFEDKTTASGLDFAYRNGEDADHFTILESLGGGVALLDYDQDGLIDVFVTGGGWFDSDRRIHGYPNRLFRNQGHWRFRDVTSEVGLPENDDRLFYSNGCSVGDYDNDGWPDLLVTGYGRMALYRNRKGTFIDVTAAAGLVDRRDPHWSTSAAWADFRGAGHLDLFVCHYVNWSFANHPQCKSGMPDKERDICSPAAFKPLLPALHVNLGNGTFKEAGAGLIAGNGLGVIALHADEDDKLDIFVANDQSGNYLYLNQGQMTFREVGAERGVAFGHLGNRDGSMGVAAADFDRSGFLSIFVTNFQHEEHSLFQNRGGAHFHHASKATGISALGMLNVGFGVGFFDFDLDGAEDLFIANGHVVRYPLPPSTFKQRPYLLRNMYTPINPSAPKRFDVVTERGGRYFRTDHMGRGVAFGDLDNDGGIDLVISHTNEPATLLRNVVPGRGHWLGVDLVGKSCRDAIGARLTLEVAGQKLTRQVLGGGSYLSSSDRRIVFGLGKTRTVDKLTVRWPSGHVQTWEGKELPLDAYCQLHEEEPVVRRK